MQIQPDEKAPVELFSSGEYHSIAVQEADRWKLINSGYTIRAMPNSDDLAYIPESETVTEGDLAARFRSDEHAPVERCDSKGRTSKGQFNNVLGVTTDGKVILDTGSPHTHTVEPDEIQPARPLSLNGAVSLICMYCRHIACVQRSMLRCKQMV